MSDYISRKDVLVTLSGLLKDMTLSELLKDIKEHPIGNTACAIEAILRINSLPAADVRPVVRGEWYNGNRYEVAQKVKLDCDGNVTGLAFCSVCGDLLGASDEYAVRGRFCPNCGADMRGVKE